MNQAWHYPKLQFDIRSEFALARDKDKTNRTKVNPAMRAIAELNGDKTLYRGLGKVAVPKPCVGFDGKVALMLCPPPAGIGHHVGILLGLDKNGALACAASNGIKQPKPTAQPVQQGKSEKESNKPTTATAFFESFNRTPANARTNLIQTIIDSACADKMDWADLMCAEAERYGTMAGFIVVLTEGRPLVFITTLVLRGPISKHEVKIFTGSISHVG